MVDAAGNVVGRYSAAAGPSAASGCAFRAFAPSAAPACILLRKDRDLGVLSLENTSFLHFNDRGLFFESTDCSGQAYISGTTGAMEPGAAPALQVNNALGAVVLAYVDITARSVRTMQSRLVLLDAGTRSMQCTKETIDEQQWVPVTQYVDIGSRWTPPFLLR